MTGAKAVNEFLLAFEKLRLCVDDDPSLLAADALEDDSVGELCLKVTHLHGEALLALKSPKPHMRSGIASQHVARLRGYREKWDNAVEVAAFSWCKKRNAEIAASDIGPQFSELMKMSEFLLDHFLDRQAKIREDLWDWADSNARQISDEIDGELRPHIAAEAEGVFSGIKSYLDAQISYGWRVHDIIRRQGLVPEVFIPVHVSDSDRFPLLYEHLSEATQSFVIGAFSGSVALLRALVEHVLKAYYGGDGSDLSEVINRVKALPPMVRRSDLHALRKTANTLLHLDDVRREPTYEGIKLRELAIVENLRVVRTLIEGIPRAGSPEWRLTNQTRS